MVVVTDYGVSMDIYVESNGTVEWSGNIIPCAIGASGMTSDKREGDQATPIGWFALRRVYYRADRVSRPRTSLPVDPLDPLDAWSDDPEDPAYNSLVRQPYRTSVELMWREDHVYDIVVPLGFNDDPALSGKGSAIFLHIARPDFSPTQGCVAVSVENLLRILADCDETTRLCIESGRD